MNPKFIILFDKKRGKNERKKEEKTSLTFNKKENEERKVDLTKQDSNQSNKILANLNLT